jgi:predicted GNAT family N-acyltransferase
VSGSPIASPPLDEHAFTIATVDWAQAAEALSAVRRRVFVEEQGVPPELEWDARDAEAIHLLARAEADGSPIGTARLLSPGQIGRMAVLPPWRGRGVGTALLIEALRIARVNGYETPWLNAQVQVVPFYAKLGFSPEGDVFDEARIPHQRMVLTDPDQAVLVDLRRRRLGRDGGLLRTRNPRLVEAAVEVLATQATRSLTILTPDLEPRLYDRLPVLATIRRLATELPGQLSVRILLIDAEPVVRRGHRIIELSQALTSGVQIRAVPEAFIDRCDFFVVADAQGYCQRRRAAPDIALIDFAGIATARRLLRAFEAIWEQGEIHQELRRLYL